MRPPATDALLARLAALLLGVALTACAKDKEPVQPEPTAAAHPASSPSASPSSSSGPGSATSAAAEPPAIDASFLSAIGPEAGLTAREDDELASVLTRLSAPCPSEAVSVAQCIAEHRACPDCDRAARYLATGVHQGWPAQYVYTAFRARFDPKARVDLPVDGSPARGPATAAVTIIEFGSYLCSHCAAEAPKLEALQRAHPKDVRLVFKPIWSERNVPQVEATRAALAAAAQGKFWEMHAVLFANQPKFDPESIDGYAKSVGVDPKKLRADMASAEVAERMKKDLAAATAAQVDSLPSIWINGHPYLSFENLEARVGFELAQK
jgi:protein-disulfide isomerase